MLIIQTYDGVELNCTSPNLRLEDALRNYIGVPIDLFWISPNKSYGRLISH